MCSTIKFGIVDEQSIYFAKTFQALFLTLSRTILCKSFVRSFFHCADFHAKGPPTELVGSIDNFSRCFGVQFIDNVKFDFHFIFSIIRSIFEPLKIIFIRIYTFWLGNHKNIHSMKENENGWQTMLLIQPETDINSMLFSEIFLLILYQFCIKYLA